MLVPGSDSKDLLSVKHYWNKVRVGHCQVMKSTQWIYAWMKSTVIAVSKSTSIYATAWYRVLKFVMLSEYKNTQVTVNLFCENATLVHCSVVVYDHILSFLLCLKECHNFKIWIHNVMWLDKRDNAYKAQSHCLTYTFTGIYVVYHPWFWHLHLIIS